ncbi:hypothetical protein AUJ84_02005 [Candidatus Pacearchaeota archaeon CG1_02_32_132]|nr:MAG: hypothetical protein AUJ84_02005 [Candidatus Pacearchaeota archaeon CG1_02_32_132]
MKKAIILCSGGLDSVVTAYYVKKGLKYDKLIILFFNYGQRALENERKYSKLCAKNLEADFVELNLRELGKISNSLINTKKIAKKLQKKDLGNTNKESKKYYVPARNAVFLSYAFSLADSFFVKDGKNSDVFIGFKNEGSDGYPDTSPKFVEKINNLQKVATFGKSKLIAPLIKMDKEDIIQLGRKIGVDFHKTFSCYLDLEKHCGTCLACRLRQQGFYWANEKDYTDYLRT